MNFLHLKYLIEVEKYESISKAAQHLYINQPRLSKIIKEIEEEANIKIFERHNKGVVPTTKGREFLSQAKKIVQEVDYLKNMYQDDPHKLNLDICVPRSSYISEAFIEYLKMDNNMKKRWISLYVENQVGVLSKISGLFSGKCYNLDSLTVGTTEDPTVSRMTIATVSDDETFEQIKKQLNRMIEVIKVIDFTDVFVRMKEILYVKVLKCTPEDKVEIFQIAETFKAKVIDYGKDSLLVEFVQTATKNDAVVKLMKEEFKSIEVVRGGSVGIESISMMER